MDGSNRASDAVIWLRNAGGKSSILNLFFALVRPGKLNFLGGSGSTGKASRSLRDYVLEGDRAVVAAEWELEDGPRRGKPANQGPLLDGLDDNSGPGIQLAGPAKYLTGAFYELSPPGRADAGTVHPLFFAARVVPDEPGFTLDGLPLFVSRADGRRTRRSLTDFKQEWHNLGLAHPVADAREVTRPGEWIAILEDAQLDPDLFAKQIEMNRREGGADALFRFRDAAEFLDFFLELTLEPDHCEQVAQNLEAFRHLLTRRATQLLPQRELIWGARERLNPFLLVHDERAAVLHRAERASALLSSLAQHCQSRFEELSRGAEVDKASMQIADEKANNAHAKSLSHHRRAAALRFHAEIARGQRLTEAARMAGEQLAQAKQARAIWTAAAPLHEFLAYEAEAAGHLARLDRVRTEQSPLLEEVHEAAGRFARALRARIKHYQGEQRRHLHDESGLREAARGHQQDAQQAKLAVVGQLARADELARRDEEANAARLKLRDSGALLPEEPPTAALERWKAEGSRLEAGQRLAETEEERLRGEAGRIESELRTTIRDKLAAEADRTVKSDALTTALVKRHSLEGNPLLPRCLDLEAVDLERIDPSLADHRLLEMIAAVQTTAIDLRLGLAAGQRALESLAATRLLPPDLDVERLRQVLAAKVRVFPGWEYLAQNRPPAEQRQFVLEAPEVADGIVVPNDDWSGAMTALAENAPELDRPIVIVAQGTLESGAAERERAAGNEMRCVVGPTSDAHFDPAAGDAEFAVRQARADENRESLRLSEQELADLRGLADGLRAFRKDYPLGWFVERTSAIASLDERLTAMRRREEQLILHQGDLAAARRRQEEAAKQRGRDAAAAALQMQKLEQYLQTHGADEYARARERQACLDAAESARSTASMREDAARGCDTDANAFGALATEAGTRAQEEKSRLASIAHLKAADADHHAAETLPDAEALGRSYKYLVAEYETRIGLDGAQLLHKNACDNKQAAWTRFERAVRAAQDIDETSVRQALDTLPDYADAAQQLHQATTNEARFSTEHNALVKNKSDSDKSLDVLRRDFSKHHNGAIPKLASLCAVADLTPEAIAEIAERETHDGEAQDGSARSYQQAAQAARSRYVEASAAAERFRGLGKRLDSLQNSHRKILTAHPGQGFSASPVAMPLSLEESEEQIGSLERELPELSQEAATLDTRRQQAADTLRHWVSSGQFAELRLELVDRLRADPPEVLERSAAAKCADLDLWAVHLDAEIASVDGHRARVANTLLDAALDGLNLLRSAERRSKLPAGLGQLSGESFLRIRTREPAEHAERLARMHRVIDEVVATDSPPGGLGLIQRAVQGLVQPVSAQVLFPDPDVPARFVPVETLSTQSGGERLTCAVLLYCALVRLRTQHRRTGSTSGRGVLVLDNPIGTASRRKFVRMQREAARAMGVQLLYTTAVHDLEALRELPAIVRLRNERRDRHTGQRGVELDPKPLVRPLVSGNNTSELTTARLVRPEDSPPGVSAELEGPSSPAVRNA